MVEDGRARARSDASTYQSARRNPSARAELCYGSNFLRMSVDTSADTATVCMAGAGAGLRHGRTKMQRPELSDGARDERDAVTAARPDAGDGGPAFPSSDPDVLKRAIAPLSAGSHYAGMSLRDYFAAHAPDVPDWFEIVHVRQPERPIAVDAPVSSERLRRAISDYRRDPCFDLESCGETAAERSELIAFARAQDEYSEVVRRWRIENFTARLCAWRYAYADAMLAPRAPSVSAAEPKP